MNDEDAALATRHQAERDALRRASPDDWHRYAHALNWDEPLDGLYWIVQQPECDRATAHLVFWKGEPTGYEWETDDGVMGDDDYSVAPMLRYIAERFHAEGYPRSEIAYDFLADHGLDMPEYHAMEKERRLRDIRALEQRQEDNGWTPRLHPDLKALTIPGRKVAADEDEPAFSAHEAPPTAPAAASFAPPAPPPQPAPAADPIAVQRESAASAKVRDLRRQASEASAPDEGRAKAGGWLRRLFGR